MAQTAAQTSGLGRVTAWEWKADESNCSWQCEWAAYVHVVEKSLTAQLCLGPSLWIENKTMHALQTLEETLSTNKMIQDLHIVITSAT